MHAEVSAGALLVLGLSSCLVTPPPKRVYGASLVEIASEKPGEDYTLVETVLCDVNESGLSREAATERCHLQLRERAASLDADVVFVEGGVAEGNCPGCVKARAGAYRRELPWTRATRLSSSAAAEPVPGEPAEIASGTGFFVAADGRILTAHHVVEGARSIHVSTVEGAHAVARIGARKPSVDLAVLEAKVTPAGYLTVVESSTTKVGDPVWTLGFPVVGFLGVEPKFTDGSVSSLSGPGDAPELIQVTVPIQPGNSGGPLVNDGGHVVGVVTSSAAIGPFVKATGTLPQGINFAVKADLGASLYGAPEPAPAAANRTEAVERARRALVLIEAVHGDGLLLGPEGFGDGLAPASVTADAYAGLRKRCAARNADACLSVAQVVVSECKALRTGSCRHARFANTVVSHACAVGRKPACTVLRSR